MGGVPFGLDFLPFILLYFLVFPLDHMRFYKLPFKFFYEHIRAALSSLSSSSFDVFFKCANSFT